MSALGHARASSGGQNGAANGATGFGPGRSSARAYPPIEELQLRAGAEMNATINASFDGLLDQLRQCNQQAKTDVAFKRPDRAYVEYTKGAEIVRTMQQHREYPYLRPDRVGRFTAYKKEHDAQTPMLKEIEALIEESNSAAQSYSAPSTAPPPLPVRSNGVPSQRASLPPNNMPNGTSSRPASQTGVKRVVSGPHDELHFTSGMSNGSPQSASQDPLVARFAQLRPMSAGSNKLPYPMDDGALRMALNGATVNEMRPSKPPSNQANPLPDNKLHGPRPMPANRPDAPPPPPKIPLNTSLSSLPKAPSPVYSPIRAPPGKTTSSQRATPRSSIDSLDHRLSNVSSRNSYDPQQIRRREISDTRPPLPNSNSITAEQLYHVFKSYQVLVIDVRPREQFDDGHIHAKSVICIEPLSLQYGIDFDELRDRMVYSPDSEVQLLDRLSEYDLVVYHDQVTATDSFLQGSPKTTVAPTLRALFDTMTEFNYGARPRRPPAVLLGGVDAWVDLVGINALQITQTSLAPRSQVAPRPARRPTHRVSLVGQNSSREIRQRRMRGYDPLNADEEREWREKARREEEKAANIPDEQVNGDAPSGPNPPYPTSPSTIHTLEDFFRRFPEPSEIPVSMVAPRPDIAAPRPAAVPPVPSRPPPAAPRQSYGGVSEGGAAQQATSVRPSASVHPPRYTSRFLVQQIKLPRTGLVNFGVTCYMNATIQCLVATTPLLRFFLEDSWRHYVQKNWKGSQGIMPEIFSNLVRGMWKDGGAALRPVSLRTFCARLNPEWGVDRQQDAKEFLDFLVDCLHEDLNQRWHRTALAPLTERQEAERERRPAHEVSRVEWERYTHREYSFVGSLFAGQHASRLRCAKCGHTSTTYEAFFSISVEIPHTHMHSSVSLQQCLQSYCKEERLAGDEEWRCPQCRRQREAYKRLRITRLPPVLVVHLKRFSAGHRDGNARKVHTRVDFPLHGLDMEPYTLDARAPPPPPGGAEHYPDEAVTPPFVYDAFGVMRHIGSTGNGGHYTALVKDRARGVWRKFDDDKVTDFDPARLKSKESLQNEQAYIVFYERAKPR